MCGRYKMAVFNIPASPVKNTLKIDSFLGVDFTSDINEIDTRRTPEGQNFINNNGAIEKINGYKILERYVECRYNTR